MIRLVEKPKGKMKTRRSLNIKNGRSNCRQREREGKRRKKRRDKQKAR